MWQLMPAYMRGLFAALALAGGVAAGSTGTLAGPDYCVREVPLVRPAGHQAADPRGGIRSGNSQQVTPGYFRLPAGADFPLVYDVHTTEAPAGGQATRSPFWALGRESVLTGPYDAGFSARLDQGGYASDRSGTTLVIGGRYTTDGAGTHMYGSGGRRWQTRIFEHVLNAAPRPLDPDLQQAIEQPRAVFWSDVMNGFLISSVAPKGSVTLSFRSTLLRGDRLSPIDLHGIDLAADLPKLGVAGLLDFGSLRFVDPDGNVQRVASLNSGDDYNGWEALVETRDDGWLYADGAQYDNAVHVERIDGAWRATSIVRIADDGGLADGVLRTVLGINTSQMERDGLSTIVRAGTCRRYSTAIRRMIFCDEMYELRAGELTPIGDRGLPLTDFLGDVERLGLGLFRGAAGRLFSYDGETLRPIEGARAGGGLLHDLPEVGRTFQATRGGIYELRGPAAALELVPVEAPGQGASDFFTRFFSAPDGKQTLAFTRRGIYLVERGEMTSLWPAPCRCRSM